MPDKLNPHFRRLLAHFEQAVRAQEVKGALPPSEWRSIEEDYQQSKAAILSYAEGKSNDS